MSSLQLKELMTIGQDLGFKDEALQKFVKEEQDRERQDRLFEREAKQAEAQRKHELEMIKERRELEKLQEERQSREHARQLELLEKQQQKAESKVEHIQPTLMNKGPKLPAFEEEKDNIDSYIQRFERYATAQRWVKETHWAANLSALLKGRALDVFTRLPVEESLNYDVLKGALLRRFEMTEEGFRKKFRTGRPEHGETFAQFAVRLENDFIRWLEMALVEKTYAGLKDLVVRDQFLQTCGTDLKLFLKERSPKSVKDMASLADQFAEARGNTASSFVRQKQKFEAKGSSREKEKGRTDDGQRHGSFTKASMEHSSKNQKDKQGSSGRYCYICKKTDHLSYNCPKNSHKANAVKGKGKESVVGSVSSEEDEGDTEMPVVQGYVGDTLVSVLRDSGCEGIVVRKNLVTSDQMTGEIDSCKVADGKSLQCPVANVFLDTPYFVGTYRCWLMEAPVYDVMIGNVKGAQRPYQPNSNWKRTPKEMAIAVQTRSQVERENRPFKPLDAPKLTSFATPDCVKNAQKTDESLRKLWRIANDGETRYRKDGGKSSFFVKKGLLYREFQSPRNANGRIFKQLVVPTNYREDVLRLAHDSRMAEHLAAKRTSERILTEFYWPGVDSDVTRYCRSCDVCQKTISKGRVTKVPLGTMPLIDVPFQRVAVDIVGPLKLVTDRGNRFILTLVDYATRYPEAVPLKSIETERVAEALVDLYSRVGVPREILTDKGAQFTSELMSEVCRLLSIRQLTTTPYHPQCNGLVERFNGTLKQMLRRMCAERPRDWDRYINSLLFAYREVPQESLGFSPFELLYGRTVRGPMMILRELWTKEVPDPETKTTYQYVLDLKEKLEETCELAHKQLKSAQIRPKKYFNRKAKDRNLMIGEKVLVLLPTKSNKLQMQWRGPYPIVERVGAMDYKVSIDGKPKTLHANLLRQYVERKAGKEQNTACATGVLSVISASVVHEDDVDDDDGVVTDHLFTTPQAVKSEFIGDVLVSEKLSSTMKKEVTHLLQDYTDVFTDVPGRTHLVEHSIKTTSTDPVRVKSRSIPFNMKATIKEEVDKMMSMGVIEPSDSPYSAPVVIVRKKDGTNKFCIDYRQLNRITIFDAEPMPDAEDIFSRLVGHKFFSRLDMSKGYWQVPMSEDSKQKTAFSTPVGLYQFVVMPFGLVNSPATFCRMVRKLLNGMSNIDSFVDDLLIYTKKWTEHLEVLNELFARLRKAGLTARPTKCALGYDSLECLGHIVGQQRLLPNPDKVRAILEADRPVTKKQVRSFLGLAGFYRKFIPNFAVTAVPLTDLTKKGMPNHIIWEDPQERAFETLKKMLATSPILKLPDLEEEFILQTDASDYGIGAILLQKEEDHLLPVAYASRKLKDSERAYAVVEKECLAVVWAVQKFQKYLYGREFVLETDHQPLVYLNKMKGVNSRLMRWALQLQPYRIKIRAIRGRDNVGADFLSRM
ncbi:uncharacterized protein [Argopecten irradians]|uniref:uncharacterized protein n=1 Tax=Argopecten irradians TaxID=31199 RepID=UPI0037173FB9